MAALLRRPGTAERNDEIEPLADRLIRQIGKRLARGQRVTRGDGEANDLAPPPHRWQYRRRRRPGRRRLDHHGGDRLGRRIGGAAETEPDGTDKDREHGRAPGRERGGQYVSISVGAE